MAATVMLACAAPLAWAQGRGSVQAEAHANEHAVAAGGNLGHGAAPLPEPSTWIAMGTLVIAAAWIVASKRRRQTA